MAKKIECHNPNSSSHNNQYVQQDRVITLKLQCVESRLLRLGSALYKHDSDGMLVACFANQVMLRINHAVNTVDCTI